MGTSVRRPGGSAEIVRHRERIGTTIIALFAAWLVYALGLFPLALAAFGAVEGTGWRVGLAMGAVSGAVFAAANARAIGAALRPLVRRAINYVTPVLPASVTAERLGHVQSKLAAIDARAASAAELRVANEAEVARLRAERATIVREATREPRRTDDATLARQLSRNQEALARREAQLEQARADEAMLLDAREVCDVCAQRLAAARERYHASLEVARAVTGVRALFGATGPDEESARAAEEACLAELSAVDEMMMNLDGALYDRRLEERAAALQLAELRTQAAAAPTVVRVATPPPLPRQREQDAARQHEAVEARRARNSR